MSGWVEICSNLNHIKFLAQNCFYFENYIFHIWRTGCMLKHYLVQDLNETVEDLQQTLNFVPYWSERLNDHFIKRQNLWSFYLMKSCITYAFDSELIYFSLIFSIFPMLSDTITTLLDETSFFSDRVDCWFKFQNRTFLVVGYHILSKLTVLSTYTERGLSILWSPWAAYSHPHSRCGYSNVVTFLLLTMCCPPLFVEVLVFKLAKSLKILKICLITIPLWALSKHIKALRDKFHPWLHISLLCTTNMARGVNIITTLDIQFRNTL